MATSGLIGKSVEIRCLAPEGEPKPTLYWLKNQVAIERTSKRLLVSHEGSLLINEIRASDAGNYTCVAENIAGKRVSDAALLSVAEDRGWSEWSAWSECLTGGGCDVEGVQTRKRTCLNPPTVNNAIGCDGFPEQSVACYLPCATSKTTTTTKPNLIIAAITHKQIGEAATSAVNSMYILPKISKDKDTRLMNQYMNSVMVSASRSSVSRNNANLASAAANGVDVSINGDESGSSSSVLLSKSAHETFGWSAWSGWSLVCEDMVLLESDEHISNSGQEQQKQQQQQQQTAPPTQTKCRRVRRRQCRRVVTATGESGPSDDCVGSSVEYVECKRPSCDVETAAAADRASAAAAANKLMRPLSSSAYLVAFVIVLVAVGVAGVALTLLASHRRRHLHSSTSKKRDRKLTVLF